MTPPRLPNAESFARKKRWLLSLRTRKGWRIGERGRGKRGREDGGRRRKEDWEGVAGRGVRGFERGDKEQRVRRSTEVWGVSNILYATDYVTDYQAGKN